MGDFLTVIIVAGVILTTIFATKRYINNLGKGCCGSGGDSIKVKDKNIKNYPYHAYLEVEGMHCGNCAKRIEAAFNNRGGIYSKANHKTGHVDIHLKSDLPNEKIISIIASNGYEVKSIRR